MDDPACLTKETRSSITQLTNKIIPDFHKF